MGSVYLSFGLLSILGLKAPLKFVPVLLLQLCYKVVWFIGVVAPILFTGKFQPYAILHVVIFLTYIVGDLIAIPFSYVFGKEIEAVPERVIPATGYVFDHWYGTWWTNEPQDLSVSFTIGIPILIEAHFVVE